MEIHHENLCDNLFRSVLLDTSHKISHLLPQRHDSGHFLRNENNFNIPFIKPDRTKNSFIFERDSTHFLKTKESSGDSI